ncbi:hypothetical protein CH305_04975 [Rhodococcus sp. 15-649-2-2]|nr:hypothetical protein CH305_04975 [Rhodococcus sp. 15-649-2-2]
MRGKARHPDFYGRDVPHRVKTPPHLGALANRLFVLVPLVWLFSDLNRRSTSELAGLAAYVFVVVIFGGYPFEKVKSL